MLRNEEMYINREEAAPSCNTLKGTANVKLPQ